MFINRFAGAAVLALCASAASGATLTNGGFENGLNGWTVTEFNGGTFSQGTQSFDTNGDASATNAAMFSVGRGTNSRFGSFGGIRLSQDFAVDEAGEYALSFDFAALGREGLTNASAGFFELVLNGTSLGSQNLGTITSLQVLRGSLSATAMLAQGTSTLAIEISREYLFSENTPKQFVDNVSLESVSEVPLPAGMPLLLAGLGTLAVVRRKSKA